MIVEIRRNMIVEIRETYSCKIKCSIFIPLIILHLAVFI